MYKIFLLCKLQFKEIFAIGKTNKKRFIGYGITLALIGLFFLGISIAYTIIIGKELDNINKINYLPSLFFTLTSIVTFVTTLYQVRGMLFGSKDYEIIQSLPVNNAQIVISKIIVIYLYEFAFTFILMLPSEIFYFTIVTSTTAILSTILTIFLVPIFPMSLAIFIGFIISFVLEKLPFKNVIQVVLTTILISLVLVFAFQMGQNGGESLALIISRLTDYFEKIYPIMGIFTYGCIYGNVLYLLMYIGINIGAIVFVTTIISLCYKTINNWILFYQRHKVYVKKQLKKGNQFTTFFNKEWKTYINSPFYFLTTIIGGALSICCASFLAVEYARGGFIMHLGDWKIDLIEILRPYLSVIICSFVGLTSLTSSSISIEGNCFWIIKSSPVNYRNYLGVKILLNQLVIGGCALISSIILIAVINLDISEILMVVFAPQAFILFNGSIGLGVNLRHPKFQWNNEQNAIKISSSSLFSSLCGIAFIAVLTLIIFFTSSISLILALVLCCGLFIGDGFLIFFSLIKNADKIIENI